MAATQIPSPSPTPATRAIFVVQQNGLVKIVGGGTFLDMHTRVACCGEQGLLGLAFHPDYNNSGTPGYKRFYVTFTRSGDGAIVLAEFKRSVGNVNAADPNSYRRLLVIPHPGQQNHNGGWIGLQAGHEPAVHVDGRRRRHRRPAQQRPEQETFCWASCCASTR